MSNEDDDESSEQPEHSGAAYAGQVVWVFMGDKGNNPMGVWSSLANAHRYIHDQQLTGSLTRFELDVPVYEWAIAQKLFKPKQDLHRGLKFRQMFSNKYQEHYTFKDGHCAALGNPQYVEDEE